MCSLRGDFVNISNENEYTRADNSDYITKKDVKCRWKDNPRDEYTSAFNIDNIQRENSILTETLTKWLLLLRLLLMIYM